MKAYLSAIKKMRKTWIQTIKEHIDFNEITSETCLSIDLLSAWIMVNSSQETKTFTENLLEFLARELKQQYGCSFEKILKTFSAYNKALEQRIKGIQFAIGTTIYAHVMRNDSDYVHLESEMLLSDAIVVFMLESKFYELTKSVKKFQPRASNKRISPKQTSLKKDREKSKKYIYANLVILVAFTILCFAAKEVFFLMITFAILAAFAVLFLLAALMKNNEITKENRIWNQYLPSGFSASKLNQALFSLSKMTEFCVGEWMMHFDKDLKIIYRVENIPSLLEEKVHIVSSWTVATKVITNRKLCYLFLVQQLEVKKGSEHFRRLCAACLENLVYYGENEEESPFVLSDIFFSDCDEIVQEAATRFSDIESNVLAGIAKENSTRELTITECLINRRFRDNITSLKEAKEAIKIKFKIEL